MRAARFHDGGDVRVDTIENISVDETYVVSKSNFMGL